jgi:hypothetical protein
MAATQSKQSRAKWCVAPRIGARFCGAAPWIALLFLAMLSREIAAQSLPRPATSVRNRSIDQKLATLLAPIPLYVSGQDIYPLQQLRKRGSLVAKEEPLDDVVERLAHQFNVTIVLDAKALDEASVISTMLITSHQTDAPLKTLLDQLLRPLELTWLQEGGIIQVTTEEKAKTQLETVIYPVQDLVNVAAREVRFFALADAISENVDPDSWNEAGGPGRIMPIRSLGVLVISQTSDIHQRVLEYLADLRKRRAPGVDWEAARIAAMESIVWDMKQRETPQLFLDYTEAEVRLLEQLDRIVSFDVEEMPLDDFVHKLRTEQKLSVQLDQKALDEASIAPDQPISVKAHQVTLRRALRLVLQPLEATYLVRNERIEITTAEKAKVMGQIRLFPVGDLLTKGAHEPSIDPDTLTTLIYETVSPDSWEEAGGPGRITCDQVTRSLTVHNTSEVLDAINDFLTAIRIAKDRLQTIRQHLDGTTLPPPTETEQPKARATSIPKRPFLGNRELGGKLPGKRSTTPIPLDPRSASPAVYRQLETRISLEKPAIQFSELLERFQDQYGIRSVIDPSAQYPRFNDEEDVAIEVYDVSLGTALTDVLSRYDLAYQVVDETVVIASADMVQSILTSVAYPVHDLVAGDKGSDYQELAQYVTGFVVPDSWEEAGGPATIRMSPKIRALIAHQTSDAHRQIEHLLTLLRRAKAISDSQVRALDHPQKSTSLISQRFVVPQSSRRRFKGDDTSALGGGGGFFAIEDEFTPDR